MINALLRIQPSAKTCTLEDFLDCFERNLDISDSVAAITPVRCHVRRNVTIEGIVVSYSKE